MRGMFRVTYIVPFVRSKARALGGAISSGFGEEVPSGEMLRFNKSQSQKQLHTQLLFLLLGLYRSYHQYKVRSGLFKGTEEIWEE